MQKSNKCRNDTHCGKHILNTCIDKGTVYFLMCMLIIEYNENNNYTNNAMLIVIIMGSKDKLMVYALYYFAFKLEYNVNHLYHCHHSVMPCKSQKG